MAPEQKALMWHWRSSFFVPKAARWTALTCTSLSHMRSTCLRHARSAAGPLIGALPTRRMCASADMCHASYIPALLQSCGTRLWKLSPVLASLGPLAEWVKTVRPIGTHPARERIGNLAQSKLVPAIHALIDPDVQLRQGPISQMGFWLRRPVLVEMNDDFTDAFSGLRCLMCRDNLVE